MKLKIEAKNSLENYVYSVKSSINEEKVASILSEDDKKTAETTVEETLKWLSDNQSADKNDYEEKKKEVEGKLMPIMSKLGGGQSSGAGAAGGMPEGFDPSQFASAFPNGMPEGFDPSQFASGFPGGMPQNFDPSQFSKGFPGAPSGGSQKPSTTTSEPKIEEVD